MDQAKQNEIEELPLILDNKLKAIAYADPYLKDQDWQVLMSEHDLRQFDMKRLSTEKNAHFKEPDFQCSKEILKELRAALAQTNADAMLIYRRDEFDNEYVPPCNERLAFATGFTGSAGMAIITAEQAVLFTDGRYTLQAQEQSPLFEQVGLKKGAVANWLKQNLKKGQALGIDPNIASISDVMSMTRVLKKIGANVVRLDQSPLDSVWAEHDRPPQPLSALYSIDDKIAGQSYKDKLKEVLTSLKQSRCDALILNDLPAIAWLLNLRGRDIPCTPIFLSYLVINKAGSSVLFIDPRKIPPELESELVKQGVTIQSIAEFEDYLFNMKSMKVWLDPSVMADRVKYLIEKSGNQSYLERSPISSAKAIKNPLEIAGMKKAHKIDGVALCNFLYWMDHEGQSGDKTEMDAERILEFYRRQNPAFQGPSFESIVGHGPNGAIIHYRVSKKSNRTITKDTLFLCDSGAQYYGDDFMGTTDVTRTIPIGRVSDEMIKAFTLVLKGHIALYLEPIKKDTTPAKLDARARDALRKKGLDYAHGTGHGVGAHLGVHEGPIGISRNYTTQFEEGMILSNEPGFYKQGEYGIRIENLVVLEPLDEDRLCMESLTLAPIDHRLIDVSMLSEDERNWLNRYHNRVYEEISPHLDKDKEKWLSLMTRPL